MTACELIQQFGSDDFTSMLIIIAFDSNHIARRSAIDALAFNRSDASVKALKELLNSPDATVRTLTESALRRAYNSRGNAHGKRLFAHRFRLQIPRTWTPVLRQIPGSLN